MGNKGKKAQAQKAQAKSAKLTRQAMQLLLKESLQQREQLADLTQRLRAAETRQRTDRGLPADAHTRTESPTGAKMAESAHQKPASHRVAEAIAELDAQRERLRQQRQRDEDNGDAEAPRHEGAEGLADELGRKTSIHSGDDASEGDRSDGGAAMEVDENGAGPSSGRKRSARPRRNSYDLRLLNAIIESQKQTQGGLASLAEALRNLTETVGDALKSNKRSADEAEQPDYEPFMESAMPVAKARIFKTLMPEEIAEAEADLGHSPLTDAELVLTMKSYLRHKEVGNEFFGPDLLERTTEVAKEMAVSARRVRARATGGAAQAADGTDAQPKVLTDMFQRTASSSETSTSSEERAQPAAPRKGNPHQASYALNLLPKPPTFNGFKGKDVSDVKAWWRHVREYTDAIGMQGPTTFRLQCFLSGRALQWLHGMKDEWAKAGRTPSIDELEREFLTQYHEQRLDPKHVAYTSLFQLGHKQREGEAVTQYANKFRQLVREAQDVPEPAQIAAFLAGLTPVMKRQCDTTPSGGTWASITELIDFAIGAETRQRGGVVPVAGGGGPRGGRRFDRKSDKDPSLAAVHAPMKRTAASNAKKVKAVKPAPNACKRCDADLGTRERLCAHIANAECEQWKAACARGDAYAPPFVVEWVKRNGKSLPEGMKESDREVAMKIRAAKQGNK